MRIVSTSQPTASGADAPQQQGLRGVQLPSSIATVGGSFSPAHPAANAAAAPAPTVATATTTSTGGDAQ
jgi:type VI secretion system protein ImpL